MVGPSTKPSLAPGVDRALVSRAPVSTQRVTRSQSRKKTGRTVEAMLAEQRSRTERQTARGNADPLNREEEQPTRRFKREAKASGLSRAATVISPQGVPITDAQTTAVETGGVKAGGHVVAAGQAAEAFATVVESEDKPASPTEDVNVDEEWEKGPYRWWAAEKDGATSKPRGEARGSDWAGSGETVTTGLREMEGASHRVEAVVAGLVSGEAAAEQLPPDQSQGGGPACGGGGGSARRSSSREVRGGGQGGGFSEQVAGGATRDASNAFVEELGRRCGQPGLEDWWSLHKGGVERQGGPSNPLTKAAKGMSCLHAAYNTLAALTKQSATVKLHLIEVLDQSVRTWRASEQLRNLARPGRGPEAGSSTPPEACMYEIGKAQGLGWQIVFRDPQSWYEVSE